jgi:hypothetical protein
MSRRSRMVVSASLAAILGGALLASCSGGHSTPSGGGTGSNPLTPCCEACVESQCSVTASQLLTDCPSFQSCYQSTCAKLAAGSSAQQTCVGHCYKTGCMKLSTSQASCLETSITTSTTCGNICPGTVGSPACQSPSVSSCCQGCLAGLCGTTTAALSTKCPGLDACYTNNCASLPAGKQLDDCVAVCYGTGCTEMGGKIPSCLESGYTDTSFGCGFDCPAPTSAKCTTPNPGHSGKCMNPISGSPAPPSGCTYTVTPHGGSKAAGTTGTCTVAPAIFTAGTGSNPGSIVLGFLSSSQDPETPDDGRSAFSVNITIPNTKCPTSASPLGQGEACAEGFVTTGREAGPVSWYMTSDTEAGSLCYNPKATHPESGTFDLQITSYGAVVMNGTTLVGWKPVHGTLNVTWVTSPSDDSTGTAEVDMTF